MWGKFYPSRSILIIATMWIGSTVCFADFLRFRAPQTIGHFESVNPEAPKGGELRVSWPDRFSTLNHFGMITARPGLPYLGGEEYEKLVFQTLMVRSLDEPGVFYGLLADEIKVDAEFRSIDFTLDRKARWNDGSAVTVEDVVSSFESLKREGHPRYRQPYKDVRVIPDSEARTNRCRAARNSHSISG